MKPAFLITIDTEGDNLWSRPREITTKNSAFLPRFQSLCERFGFKPTYLVNWEMANSPNFVEFGQDILARSAGEIGMHLHAWNSPPTIPLTENDFAHQPYLTEYPQDQIAEKVRVMTQTLETVFGTRPTSHRAGRWGFDSTYARILAENGYTVDCSVTPHVSWRFCKGDPRRDGGPDFTDFPEKPYFLDLSDIKRPGDSCLLELPATIVRTAEYPSVIESTRAALAGSFFGTRVMRKLFPNSAWLMPTGTNGPALLRVLQAVRDEHRPYAMLVLHSSELMPGGSPKLKDERAIDRLYADLESLFAGASDFAGTTLAEFHKTFDQTATDKQEIGSLADK